MEKVKIETEMIQLDQFLKWAGEIRFLLDEQRIFVNGELCSAKRKKLHVGDIVEIKGIGTYEIVGA